MDNNSLLIQGPFGIITRANISKVKTQIWTLREFLELKLYELLFIEAKRRNRLWLIMTLIPLNKSQRRFTKPRGVSSERIVFNLNAIIYLCQYYNTNDTTARLCTLFSKKGEWINTSSEMPRAYRFNYKGEATCGKSIVYKGQILEVKCQGHTGLAIRARLQRVNLWSTKRVINKH